MDIATQVQYLSGSLHTLSLLLLLLLPYLLLLRSALLLDPCFFPALLPQSLVAFHLGKGDRRSAAAVFRRTLTVAVAAGVLITGGLLASQASLPAVFTKDAEVVRQVAMVRGSGVGGVCLQA
jgi:hypothetical protein